MPRGKTRTVWRVNEKPKDDIAAKRQMINQKLQEATEENKEENNDDIFYLVNAAINDFNVFLKNSKIDKAKLNCIQSVFSAIRFVLFRPVVEFDVKKSVFSVSTIRSPALLIDLLGQHMLLFSKFDEKGVKEDKWALNTIRKDKVQILVKVDVGKNDKTISLMNIAAKEARESGWKGMLEIITASTKVINLPSGDGTPPATTR